MTGETSGRTRGSGVRRLLTALVVLALVAGGVAVWRLDLLDRWLGDDPLADEPISVAPPPELDLPAIPLPPVVAKAGPLRSTLSRSAIDAVMRPFLTDKDLGKHVRAVVAPVGAGAPTYSFGSGRAIPASTTKLVTTSAALFSLGPEHTFATRVVSAGKPQGGGPTSIVLVGGGDPLLASAPSDDPTSYPPQADVVTLARKTAASLKRAGVRKVSLGYDDTLFGGPSVNPRWLPTYLVDVASPTTALWVDEGRSADGSQRVPDPSLSAAQTYGAALAKAGITVQGSPTPTTAAQGATEVARVTSATLEQIVERILLVSDNDATEVLFRHVGLAQGGAGTIEAGQRGVAAVLEANGIDTFGSVLYDGSGLSRDNRMDPRLLIGVLRWASRADAPELGAVLTGLPVTGFSGSLDDRMTGGPAASLGRVRAKTGTLSSVRSLAGVATDLQGNAMLFVLMADKIREPRVGLASIAQDNAAAALGGCRCGG